MKTFKSYITESRMTTHAEIVKVIAAYKKAGEILNPQYKDLIDQTKRIMRNGSGNDDLGLLDLVRKEREDRDPDLNELYYTSFDGFTSHNKIERLVNKLEKKNKPQYKTAIKNVRNYLKMWKPVGEDIKALKSKVVKVSAKRAEAKLAKNQEMARKFADSSSLIKIFESHMGEYKKMAETRAREFAKERLERLKKHDWDLDKAAPRPRGYSDYKRMQQVREVYQMLTKPTKSHFGRDEPHTVAPDRAKIEHYVKMNVQGAEDAYRSFMQKMIDKIGKPVIDAKMTGNIWTNATLTVTTDDGDQQVWTTKMIVNFSKYNKMFNQFPSRRKK